MLKRYKPFFIGLLAGAILFGLIPVYGTVTEYILHKADYKLIVNNKEYQSKELPILNYNGNTYVPLKEIGSLLNVTVNWTTSSGQVEISSPHSTMQPSAPIINPMSKKVETPDGLPIDYINGTPYISLYFISDKYDSCIRFDKTKTVGQEELADMPDMYQNINENVIYKDIPVIASYNMLYVTYDFYIQKLYPLIQSAAKQGDQ